MTDGIDHHIVIRNAIDEACAMKSVTVSPKFQVFIPRAVRESLGLRAGQKMRVLEYRGRVELIPERDIAELRGFVKDIDTQLERDGDRL